MANQNDSAIISEMMNVPRILMAQYFLENSDSIKDDANYWNVLGTLWKLGGTVKQQDLWKKLFLSDRPRRHKIMKSRERRRWRRLPETVIAFRAINSPEEIETAICWTLDRKTAEFFSQDGGRKVVERKFKKSEVFAFFDRRGEEEILVNIKLD